MTTKKITPVCEACGSSDVRRDAYAEWDEHTQTWVLAATFDQAVCEDCGGECRLTDIDAQLMTYTQEFPEPEYRVPCELLIELEARGFIDQSWQNDACPHFWSEELKFAVWTGGDEDNGEKRISFMLTDADGAPLADQEGHNEIVMTFDEAIETLEKLFGSVQ